MRTWFYGFLIILFGAPSLVSIVSQASIWSQNQEVAQHVSGGQEKQFDRKKTKKLVRILERAKIQVRSAHRKWQKLSRTQKLRLVDQIYSQSSSKYKIEIISERFRHTENIISRKRLSDLRSIEWARKHHPNSIFRDILKDRDIIGAVNQDGLQSDESDEYIEDNHIYLSNLFFPRNDKVVILLHEVGHLISIDPKEFKKHNWKKFVLLTDFAFIPMSDAYRWEDFLKLLGVTDS